MNRYPIIYNQSAGKPLDFFYYDFFDKILDNQRIAILLTNFFENGIAIKNLTKVELNKSIKKYNSTDEFAKEVLLNDTIKLIYEAAKTLKAKLDSMSPEDQNEYYKGIYEILYAPDLKYFTNDEIKAYYDRIPDIKGNTIESFKTYLRFILNKESILEAKKKIAISNLDARIEDLLRGSDAREYARYTPRESRSGKILTYEDFKSKELSLIHKIFSDYQIPKENINKMVEYYYNGKYPDVMIIPEFIFLRENKSYFKYEVNLPLLPFDSLFSAFTLIINEDQPGSTIKQVRNDISRKIINNQDTFYKIMSYWPGVKKLKDEFFTYTPEEFPTRVTEFIDFYKKLIADESLDANDFVSSYINLPLDNYDKLGGIVEIEIFCDSYSKCVNLIGKSDEKINYNTNRHVLSKIIGTYGNQVIKYNILYDDFYYYYASNGALIEAIPLDNIYGEYKISRPWKELTGKITKLRGEDEDKYKFELTHSQTFFYDQIYIANDKLKSLKINKPIKEYYINNNCIIDGRIERLLKSKETYYYNLKLFNLENEYYQNYIDELKRSLIKFKILDFDSIKRTPINNFNFECKQDIDYLIKEFDDSLKAEVELPQISLYYTPINQISFIQGKSQMFLIDNLYLFKKNMINRYYHFYTEKEDGFTLRKLLDDVEESSTLGLIFETKQLLLISRIILHKLGKNDQLGNIRLLSGVKYKYKKPGTDREKTYEIDLLILDEDNKIIAIAELKSYIDGIQKAYNQLNTALSYFKYCIDNPSPDQVIFTDNRTKAAPVKELHDEFKAQIDATQEPNNVISCFIVLNDTELQNFCKNNEASCYNEFIRDLITGGYVIPFENDAGYILSETLDINFETKIKKSINSSPPTLLDKYLYFQPLEDGVARTDIEITKDYLEKYLGKNNLIILKKE